MLPFCRILTMIDCPWNCIIMMSLVIPLSRLAVQRITSAESKHVLGHVDPMGPSHVYPAVTPICQYHSNIPTSNQLLL